MRKSHHLQGFAFTLLLSSIAAPLAACEPPAGFVDPPRPVVASLDSLMQVKEEKVIEQSLAEVMRAANRPLRIDATRALAGVTGTFRLSQGPYGTVGARRLVCKTDGSIAVEEVLATESNDAGSRFRYLVWNYTSPAFRDVAYAVGEFVRSQPAPGRTLVTWTYRFALKDGVSLEDEKHFRETFLKRDFPEWMRTQLDRPPTEDPAPSAH